MQALSNMGLVAISHGERAKVLQLTAKSIIKQVDGAAKIILSSSKDTLEHLKSARIFFERGMVQGGRRKGRRRGRAAVAGNDCRTAELSRQFRSLHMPPT